LSKGIIFNCQSSGQIAQVGSFSIVKWDHFRLTKTSAGKSFCHSTYRKRVEQSKSAEINLVSSNWG